MVRDPSVVRARLSHRHGTRSVVEEANQKAPAFSKIYREMVLITKPEKPMPRTGKGSVMRKLALQLYQSEIHNLSVFAEVPYFPQGTHRNLQI